MTRQETLRRVRWEYERLRADHPHLPHKELWRRAERAAASSDGPSDEELRRAAEVAEPRVNTTWASSGDYIGRRWIAAGVVTALFSLGIAMTVASRWEETGDPFLTHPTEFIILAFLLLPALVIVGVSAWFGSTSPWSERAWKPSILLTAGIGGGYVISFVIGITAVTGEGSDELGLALAVLIPGVFMVGFTLMVIGWLLGGGLRLLWKIGGRRDSS